MELGPWLEVELGRKGVIDVEDWAEIRRLHRAEGLSIKAIARRLKLARNTVRDVKILSRSHCCACLSATVSGQPSFGGRHV